jgi:hypothetical protein
MQSLTVRHDWDLLLSAESIKMVSCEAHGLRAWEVGTASLEQIGDFTAEASSHFVISQRSRDGWEFAGHCSNDVYSVIDSR